MCPSVAVSGHPFGYAHHCDCRLAGRPLQNAAGVRSSLSHPENEPSGAAWGKSVCHFSCQSGLPAASTEAEAGRVEEAEGEGEAEALAPGPWPSPPAAGVPLVAVSQAHRARPAAARQARFLEADLYHPLICVLLDAISDRYVRRGHGGHAAAQAAAETPDRTAPAARAARAATRVCA